MNSSYNFGEFSVCDVRSSLWHQVGPYPKVINL